MHPIIIGLDLAKHVFQIPGVDATGKVIRRTEATPVRIDCIFTKLPSYVVGMEACGIATYWGREPTALDHQVKLMPTL